jgi:hypothetical protein
LKTDQQKAIEVLEEHNKQLENALKSSFAIEYNFGLLITKLESIQKEHNEMREFIERSRNLAFNNSYVEEANALLNSLNEEFIITKEEVPFALPMSKIVNEDTNYYIGLASDFQDKQNFLNELYEKFNLSKIYQKPDISGVYEGFVEPNNEFVNPETDNAYHFCQENENSFKVYFIISSFLYTR